MKTNNIIPANTPIINQVRPKVDKTKVDKLDASKKKALHECITIKK